MKYLVSTDIWLASLDKKLGTIGEGEIIKARVIAEN